MQQRQTMRESHFARLTTGCGRDSVQVASRQGFGCVLLLLLRLGLHHLQRPCHGSDAVSFPYLALLSAVMPPHHADHGHEAACCQQDPHGRGAHPHGRGAHSRHRAGVGRARCADLRLECIITAFDVGYEALSFLRKSDPEATLDDNEQTTADSAIVPRSHGTLCHAPRSPGGTASPRGCEWPR